MVTGIQQIERQKHHNDQRCGSRGDASDQQHGGALRLARRGRVCGGRSAPGSEQRASRVARNAQWIACMVWMCASRGRRTLRHRLQLADVRERDHLCTRERDAIRGGGLRRPGWVAPCSGSISPRASAHRSPDSDADQHSADAAVHIPRKRQIRLWSVRLQDELPSLHEGAHDAVDDVECGEAGDARAVVRALRADDDQQDRKDDAPRLCQPFGERVAIILAGRIRYGGRRGFQAHALGRRLRRAHWIKWRAASFGSMCCFGTVGSGCALREYRRASVRVPQGQPRKHHAPCSMFL
eukprot:421431-Prymnesium_polylepis.2